MKLTVIGRLGKDATLNNVNGKQVINFTLAHTTRNKDGQEKTMWLDVSYWTEKTAVAQYLKKGKEVYCEGAPDTRHYVSKADGEVHSVLTLSVFQLQLVGGAGEPLQQQQAVEVKPQKAKVVEMPEDDLPF